MLNTIRYPITGVADWLALRRQYITASVIGSLFGVHPYRTAAAIWAEKSGLVPADADAEDSTLLLRGRLLEDIVAALVAKQHPNWQIEKAGEFLGSDIRLGATPDFYIKDDKGRRGVLQTKVVASLQHRTWNGTPPEHIVLQCLTEAMLDGAQFGIVAALEISDFKFDLHEYRVPRHKSAEQRLVEAAVSFWMAVEQGRMPQPDYRRDKPLIAALYPQEKAGATIDWRSDNEMPVLIARHQEITEALDPLVREKDEIETRVKERIGDNERALMDGYNITCKAVRKKEHIVKATTYRQLRITKKEAKKNGKHNRT